MITKLLNFIHDLRSRQKMIIALTKGGVGRQMRRVDLTRPVTWEFSGFSQNGEDGILDVLRSQLLNSNRYFIEIGSSDGIQNNSSWLAVVEQYGGLMVEGDGRLASCGERLITSQCIGVEYLNRFVELQNIDELKGRARFYDPDVFSLDIDGIDYYIARQVLQSGFRPKIFVVEYNSVYGSSRSVTVPYRNDFAFSSAHPSRLYYGVSIAAWRRFFSLHGYRFVTVNQHGVNAFFVDPVHFSASFLGGLQGLEYAENQFQYRKFNMSSEEQFELIRSQEFVEV